MTAVSVGLDWSAILALLPADLDRAELRILITEAETGFLTGQGRLRHGDKG